MGLVIGELNGATHIPIFITCEEMKIVRSSSYHRFIHFTHIYHVLKARLTHR